MKELNLNELSVEQKIGQLFVVRKLTDTQILQTATSSMK